MALQPGDIVIVDFVGATGVKRRPAVVVSSDEYNQTHLDVILGVLTTSIRLATTSADHVLVDWKVAGLFQPTAFRAYYSMAMPADIKNVVGRLSGSDWSAIQGCVKRSVAIN